jgi:hypothetical protein
MARVKYHDKEPPPVTQDVIDLFCGAEGYIYAIPSVMVWHITQSVLDVFSNREIN